MKIHVPAGENVYDALEKIAGFFRNHVGDCEVSDSGLNLYLEVKPLSGDVTYLNDGSFVYRDGQFADEFAQLFSVARCECKDKMLRVIDNKLSTIESDARNDVSYLERQLAQATKRRYSTVEDWERKLAEARVRLDNIPRELNWYQELKNLILDGHISWLVKFISTDVPYDIYSVALRPAICKKHSFISSPVYFYSGSSHSILFSSFTTEVNDDVDSWFHHLCIPSVPPISL